MEKRFIYTELSNLSDDEKSSEVVPFKLTTWWKWIITSTIELTDEESNVLGTCTRVNLSWNDYSKYITLGSCNQIKCKSFLFSKISKLNMCIPTRIYNVIYTSVYENGFKIEFPHMIIRYLKYLQESTKLNRYDLELAGMFLGGVSIMTADRIYFRLNSLS